MSDRYARQTVLPEVGAAGQAKLAAAIVLVVGAGGLGCPVLQYLAGAGVGRLIIVDHDTVEETNLHRQPLYGDGRHRPAEGGRRRAQRCGRLNPGVATDRRRRAPDAAECAGARGRCRRGRRCRRQLRRELHAERRLPCRGQAAGQRLRDRHGRLCRRLLRRRPELSRRVSRGVGRRRHLRHASACWALPSRSWAACRRISPCTCCSASSRQRLAASSPSTRSRLAFGGFGFARQSEPSAVVPFIAPTARDGRGSRRRPAQPRRSARGRPSPVARRLAVDGIDALLAEPLSSRRIVLCCRSGQRALAAADRLRDRGVLDLALVALG